MRVLTSKIELNFDPEYGLTAIIEERVLSYSQNTATGDYTFKIEQVTQEKDGQLAQSLNGYSKMYPRDMVQNLVAQIDSEYDPKTEHVDFVLDACFQLQLTAMQLKPRFGSSAGDWELI